MISLTTLLDAIAIVYAAGMALVWTWVFVDTAKVTRPSGRDYWLLGGLVAASIITIVAVLT